MTIIYEVSLKVEASHKAKFISWLPTHIADMLKLPGFLSATLYEEVTLADMEQQWDFRVHYQLKDKQSLKMYLDEFAESMRQEGLKYFDGHFSGQRRVLSPL